jgi:AraC-like DNA-binding protein
VRPLPGFPRLKVVGSESGIDQSYRVEGRLRSAEDLYGFEYTLSGEGAFEYRGKVYRVPVGVGFLAYVADPDVVYYFPEGATEPWRFLWVSFAGEGAKRSARNLVARHGPIYTLPRDHAIIRTLLGFRDAGPEVEISPAEGGRLVNDLLHALAESADRSRDDSAVADLARRAKAFVQERLHESINVKKTAAGLGVSREYLSRCFKAETGTTLHDYILRRKVLQACHMLKETSLSHAEISTRLGFTSGAHFSRVFRTVLHMTPRRFRAAGAIPDL